MFRSSLQHAHVVLFSPSNQSVQTAQYAFTKIKPTKMHCTSLHTCSVDLLLIVTSSDRFRWRIDVSRSVHYDPRVCRMLGRHTLRHLTMRLTPI